LWSSFESAGDVTVVVESSLDDPAFAVVASVDVLFLSFSLESVVSVTGVDLTVVEVTDVDDPAFVDPAAVVVVSSDDSLVVDVSFLLPSSLELPDP